MNSTVTKADTLSVSMTGSCHFLGSGSMRLALLVLSVLVCALPLARAIHISTSDLDEVYSGPGGVPSIGWDSPDRPNSFSSYLSVAQSEKYYGASVEETFGPPVVRMETGGDVLTPVVSGAAASGYYFDGTSYWEELPELTINFNCQKEGNSTLSVTIEASLVYKNDGEGPVMKPVNETIVFYMSKQCHTVGYREGFAIGNAPGRTDDVVRHGVVQRKWIVESYDLLDKEPIVVSSEEHMTVFHISISNPLYGNQIFEEPKVLLEDGDMVDVQVRGNAANGGIATGMAETLVLLYDCLKQGETHVSIRISLGFHGSIEFGFTKSCTIKKESDVGMPGLINIGTSRSDYSGVVTNSVVSPLWQRTGPTVVVNVTEILTNFFVSTVSGKSQELYAPLISVNPSNAFRATLSGTIRDGGVVTGSPQHFTVNYICDRASEGIVTVTVKMPHAKTVEFSYIKKCRALKRHSDHIWTIKQALVALILVAGLLGALVFGYIQKVSRQQNKKARLSGRP